MSGKTTGLAKSIQSRLLNEARARGLGTERIYDRYVLERFLYRLSISNHRDAFILKGGLLMLHWFGASLRPTRDADFLGFGALDPARLRDMMAEIAGIDGGPDGVRYSVESIQVAEIREQNAYGGYRIRLEGWLGSSVSHVQLDVGIGDSVWPEAELLDYPTLLDFPKPSLQAYRVETVIAEKYHTLVHVGPTNSRMKDLFDLYVIASESTLDGPSVAEAIRRTFERRVTALPGDTPSVLLPESSREADRQSLWSGYLRSSRLEVAPRTLEDVTALIARFTEPIREALVRGHQVSSKWSSGGPWSQG